MSSRGVGAVNVQRRTWDKDEYEKRAKERAEREAAGQFSDDEDARKRPAGASGAAGEAFRPASTGAAGPEGSGRAFLSARQEQLDLEQNLNKRKLVTDAAAAGTHGGYYCDTCECTLKDSEAWLDHINGKRHQRKLGFSMRVEKATVDSVKARLEAAKARQEQGRGAADAESARREALAEYEARLADAEEEERRRKRARKERAQEPERTGEQTTAGTGSTAGGYKPSATGSASAAALVPGPASSVAAVGSGAGPGVQPHAATNAGSTKGGESTDAGAAEDGEPDMMAIMGFSGFDGGPL